MAEQKATTRPSRPTIDTVTDNVPPHTGMIENGGLTNDPRPTVSGRGDPGSTIHLLVDGVEVGTVVVGANGTWSFAPTQPLHDGQYRLTARASNEVGMSIPSTSYSIQVDVTPPSQPKIESATEGAQPTLSGQAEAYSTVAIYDGTTLLGTTKTGIDGTWTFQVTSPLSNGTHALTVTATDPAGNTSARSDGFDVTVGPVTPPVPLAKAVLDDMGHDSGNFNFDRLTNDGKGGRLLTGHLMGALAANEKVQVSTDGGRTWFDAVMKSDGTWMVTDLNEHGGNWTIQTRVVNGDGVTGPVMAYDVELDTTSPDHVLSAVRSGNVIDVSFASKDMMVGDAINVMIGDHRVSYNLTAADIAAGRVKVTIPAGIAATMDEHTSYGVALVDRAGNISDYLVTKFVEKNSEGNGGSGISYKITDFNNEAPREIAGGIPVNFGVFTAVLSYKPTVNGKPIDQGVRVKGGSGADANEVGLVFSFKESPSFYLNNGAHAKAVSFDLENRSRYGLMARFYDDAGKLIFKQLLYSSDLNNPSGGGLHSYQIVLSDNLQFSSFTLGWFEKNEGALPATATAWIDNIGFSGGSFDGLTRTAQVDFNNEKLREIAGGIPVNFGVFTAVLSNKPTINGKPIDQGVRVKGGSGADANEVGLVFSFKEPPRFHLNNGAHAKAVSFDLDNRSGYTLMVRFYDDAGKLIFKQFLDNSDLNNPSGGGLHSYQIVLPDSLQFSSFTLGWFEKNEGALPATATAWIDNIGFSGGSFTTATWETVTELVPPADVQHVLASADAEYFGSANGTEFQLDNVSYFTNGHAGLHGGAGIDTLKLMGAGQTLDISKLLNVGGHDKITSIEIIDITGTGNNTLKLSMRDVLELGHENVFRNDGHTQLMVNGNAGDRVELSGMSGLAQDGGWANKGLVAINGQAYTLYENAAMHVELLVQSAVSTQLT
ncbi:hemolysin-type calcium-binding region [Burkholderia contaminans]|uniref:Ig-like domain-containing protein n=1 Tax=Burkholderia contaminans TaxID=488447 RepID=UPI001453CDEC|nr:Ig-like domain-containing protein [Burkholderia contaminans]VWD24968.1 hemolysin-type calcium-binding region [Burkholderia contaminans]